MDRQPAADDRGDVSDAGAQIDLVELFEHFLWGLILTDRDGRVLQINRAARRLLVPTQPDLHMASLTCCDLLCSRLGPLIGGGCIAQRVLLDGPQAEVRVDIEYDRLRTAAWVTASLYGSDSLLFLLRPGKHGDRRRRTPLSWATNTGDAHYGHQMTITTLGRFQIERTEGSLNGEWLEQRHGQLLKYLVCNRRQTVTADQIGEALWPDAGVGESRNRVRQYIHILRKELEPGRGHRGTSQLLLARRGGYVLDARRVWVDADEFEREAQAGLLAFAQGISEPAAMHLASALRLYRGDFLAEEPYLDWALEEREKWRELVSRALRVQIRIDMSLTKLDVAAVNARRLAEMEPFDTDVQKLFLELCMKRGRRSEAVRHYAFLRKRMLDTFGLELEFELLDLEPTARHAAPPGDA